MSWCKFFSRAARCTHSGGKYWGKRENWGKGSAVGLPLNKKTNIVGSHTLTNKKNPEQLDYQELWLQKLLRLGSALMLCKDNALGEKSCCQPASGKRWLVALKHFPWWPTCIKPVSRFPYLLSPMVGAGLSPRVVVICYCLVTFILMEVLNWISDQLN